MIFSRSYRVRFLSSASSALPLLPRAKYTDLFSDRFLVISALTSSTHYLSTFSSMFLVSISCALMVFISRSRRFSSPSFFLNLAINYSQRYSFAFPWMFADAALAACKPNWVIEFFP